MDLDASYGYCRRLARRTGKNFYYSFLTLPRPKRLAMCAIYAWMRRLDDTVDDAAGPAEARQALEKWEKDTRAALSAGSKDIAEGGDAIWPAFLDTVERYNIPDEYFFEIIRGAEMDLSITTYATFADLYKYCYRVASVVGLACLHVFEFSHVQAKKHGEWLGIAFQLTNILRDVKEDAQRGRIYLPLDELKAFKIQPKDVLDLKDSEELRDLIESLSYRAEAYYLKAQPVFELVMPDAQPTLRIMSEIYGGILTRLREINYDVLKRRAGLTKRQKWMAVLRQALRRRAVRRTDEPRVPDLTPRKIAVIGAGPAGLATAAVLGNFGLEVFIFEREGRLGGKAAYFSDSRREKDLENPLHLWLEAQRSARRFYRMIGARRFFDRNTEWSFFSKKAFRTLRPSRWLPFPLEWTPALRKLGLSWRECLGAYRAMLRLVTYSHGERMNLDRVAFLDWLRFHGHSDRLIDGFWRPFLAIAIPDRISGLAAGRVAFFLRQLLAARTLAWYAPIAPVSDIYNDTCKAFIKSRGVKLHLNESVSGIYFDSGWKLVTGDGASLEFDDVVIAVSHPELRGVLSPKDYAILAARTQFERLAFTPALLARLEFRQPIFEQPYTILNESPFSWGIVPQNPRLSGMHRAPFAATFMGYDTRPYTFAQNNEYLKNRVRDIWENALGEGHMPAETEIWCDDDRHFSSEPGSRGHRPDQETSLPGLWLAGDWTQTGWPAGLEGSINSGFRCAEKILRKQGWVGIRFD